MGAQRDSSLLVILFWLFNFGCAGSVFCCDPSGAFVLSSLSLSRDVTFVVSSGPVYPLSRFFLSGFVRSVSHQQLMEWDGVE